MLLPEVAAKYEALQEPGRYRLWSLDHQELNLRTLSVAEADELVAKQVLSEYLKPRKVRRRAATVTPG
ncbi:hypothetical protein LF252_15085 [Hymenobacter sp. BT728]|nr:hypothetical protein [Hymenobacter pini]